jgi:hypothetical protein
MEFTITCPLDGVIEVRLEDIDTVVVRDSERADITFVCPTCGTHITISAVVPAFLVSAIQALGEEIDLDLTEAVERVTEGASDSLEDVVAGDDDAHADAYCEYFRRQLYGVACVDDALNEIDSRSPYSR